MSKAQLEVIRLFTLPVDGVNSFLPDSASAMSSHYGHKKMGGWQWCWLAVLLLCIFNRAGAQGVVYGHFPITGASGAPWDPWDSQGYRLMAAGPSESLYYDLDLNHDGVVDFTFESGQHFSINPHGANAVLAIHNGPYDYGGLAIPVSEDDLIGNDPGDYEWINQGGSTFSATRDIGSIGYFNHISPGFAGLQFTIDGQTHYGWVRVGVPIVGFNGGWLYDYAYETAPNTAILAAVPEPAMWSLLAMGGIGLLWLRRRKVS